MAERTHGWRKQKSPVEDLGLRSSGIFSATARIEQGKWGGFHTSPKALGRWAKEAGVKKLVLKHYAIQKGVTIEPMAEEVRNEFGPDGLVVGHDLLTIDV